MRHLALILVVATVLAACEVGRKSSAGFHMPDGDPERGKAVFLEQRCNACHRVDGVSLPAPTVQPPVPVVLGGEVDHARTDGELVTAIIDPQHQVAPGYKPELVPRGGVSRMPDYGQLMTVRQMIDLVAFLQSRYKVVRPGDRKG
jgi:mono/diheme cytochrome c family protein